MVQGTLLKNSQIRLWVSLILGNLSKLDQVLIQPLCINILNVGGWFHLLLPWGLHFNVTLSVRLSSYLVWSNPSWYLPPFTLIYVFINIHHHLWWIFTCVFGFISFPLLECKLYSQCLDHTSKYSLEWMDFLNLSDPYLAPAVCHAPFLSLHTRTHLWRDGNPCLFFTNPFSLLFCFSGDNSYFEQLLSSVLA